MSTRFRVKRRRRTGGSLTAASQRVDNPSKSFKSSMSSGGGDNKQGKAWDYLDRVGELQYYVNWRSASVSRCRFIASEFDEDGKPTGQCEDPTVRAIVRDIAGGRIGQTQLLARMTTFLSVPGEGWIAMLVRTPGADPEDVDAEPLYVEPVEEWYAFSREEIKASNSKVELTLPDGSKHEFNKDVDILFRVWDQSPRKASECTSPVHAAEDILEEIVRTTATIANAAKSRLVGNGIMFVPQEMSLPAQSAPGALPAGAVPGTEAGLAWEKASSKDLQDLLYNVAKAAVDDQDSMAAFIPIIAAAPGEWIKNVTHLKFDTSVSDSALATREKAITRLARSLDVSPERLLGLGDNSNHWSAWAIGDDDVTIHLVPVLEMICDAMNREVLRAMLIDEGIDPERYTVWYDTADLTQDPDRKDEARDAHDRGAMTNEKFLEYMGFPTTDGYDLESPEGWRQLARDKAAKDVNLIPLLAPLLLGQDVTAVQTPAQPAIEPTTEETPTEDETAPEAEPTTEPDPNDEPESLPAAAYGLASMCINRALELANKRRRTRGNHAAFEGVPVHEVHLRLDPVDATKAMSLIEGWDSILDESVVRAVGLDPTRFADAVERSCKVALVGSERAFVLDRALFAARL